MTEIDKFNPCNSGKEFREKFSSFEEAWNSCERGDWMLWIAKKLCVDIRAFTLAKGHCAATVLHLMKDERSRQAVKIAIEFGEGKATIKQLNAAYAAADAAAAAAAAADDADAAAYAAYAAAYAAYAADAAAAAAAADAAAYAYAADADDAAAYAYAADAYAAAAYEENRNKTADICRKYLTEIVFELIKK